LVEERRVSEEKGFPSGVKTPKNK